MVVICPVVVNHAEVYINIHSALVHFIVQPFECIFISDETRVHFANLCRPVGIAVMGLNIHHSRLSTCGDNVLSKSLRVKLLKEFVSRYIYMHIKRVFLIFIRISECHDRAPLFSI